MAIDVGRRVIIARRPIAAGEELCFDYQTTEWDMDAPFICRCARPPGVGLVRGFAHLPPARQQVLLANAAPHIMPCTLPGKRVAVREPPLPRR